MEGLYIRSVMHVSPLTKYELYNCIPVMNEFLPLTICRVLGYSFNSFFFLSKKKQEKHINKKWRDYIRSAMHIILLLNTGCIIAFLL